MHNNIRKVHQISYFAILFFTMFSCTLEQEQLFTSKFSESNRTWIGPEYWANRLQDWRLENGRLICLNQDDPMRTVHILNRNLSSSDGNFSIELTLGAIDSTGKNSSAGILIGAGAGLDYRKAALIHHSYGKKGGLYVGISAMGKLFIRDFETENEHLGEVALEEDVFASEVTLKLEVTYVNEGHFIAASVWNMNKNLGALKDIQVLSDRLVGSIALVSNPKNGKGRFWFDDWKIAGDKIEIHKNRNAGPILGTQHTLNKHILKLTAQLMPVGDMDSQMARLEVKKEMGWRKVQEAALIIPGYTAAFRIENWDDTKDIEYRVAYDIGPDNPHYSYGKIRKNPKGDEALVVAAFTGNHNNMKPALDSGFFPWDKGLWFPHEDLIGNFMQHKPDVLFFSGDQVYEGSSPTRPDMEHAELDYLYKWYLWCWAFKDLTAEIPTITIPDDHDVFHGNIWGESGKSTPKGYKGAKAQDAGGYKMPAEWVKMVERTQTSHMPDPFDATPVNQGIGVYYTDFSYGGISFAIIEDRKFKSAPGPLIPEAEIWNGWARNTSFNVKNDSDVTDAVLLGQRQLDFLEQWAADWQKGTIMKAVLSQTIFNDVVTAPETNLTDANFPSLEIHEKGGYPEIDIPVTDMDSNGWPKSGRDRAVRKLRKAFAVHIAGDQHLGSTVQYGVDTYGDSGFALCVPSIANFYPRRWFPKYEGGNHIEGAPKYTGDYEDGFGNKMTVHAVSNPYVSHKLPKELHDKAAGYGIVTFHKGSREITLENWPRWADAAKGDSPYEGWPITISQEANYGREARGYLPEIKSIGITDPVVQVYDETAEEIVYTLRTKGNTFLPKVFDPAHSYTVKVGKYLDDKAEPQVFKALKTGTIGSTIEVRFNGSR